MRQAFVIGTIFVCPSCAVFAQFDGLAHATAPRDGVWAGEAARMPVKEVTVFKDGHAFVLHEGRMPTDPAGNVVLDDLPAPVIGTFWPFSADPNVKLTGVVAARRKVEMPEPAIYLTELLRANPGAEALITEVDGQSYQATLIGIPARPVPCPNNGDRAVAPEATEVTGDVVLLRTPTGIKVVQINRIRDVTFLTEPVRSHRRKETRDLLTMRLDWGGEPPAPTVSVGLMYLQKGIRWIPSYRVTIDGAGSAIVELQATLLNELADLEDVTAHLVIGVPTFAFEETLDPMALRQTMARLSPYFETGTQTAFAFSNAAIVTQRARAGEYRNAQPPRSNPVTPAQGPDLDQAGKNEDLFVFTVKNLTLPKGARMVLPITTVTLPYKDVYKLDLPFTPPMEVRRSFGNRQQAELAQLFAAPKAMHVLRLHNDSTYPLTTAPAMIIKEDRLLGQGLMTYTAAGGRVDLPVTATVDIRVARSETETERIPDAVHWHGDSYAHIKLAGTIGLTNFLNRPIEIEVVRHVLGNVASADHDGRTEMINTSEDSWRLDNGPYPGWWNWYSWPYWWYHFNGIGRFTWNLTVEPKAQAELNYEWYYLWH